MKKFYIYLRDKLFDENNVIEYNKIEFIINLYYNINVSF